MDKKIPDVKFQYSPEGYLEAKDFLKKEGVWKEVSTTGFSVDGWSIIQTANLLYEKKILKLK